MSSMMHYNPRCRYGGLHCCPVQGSRGSEHRSIQQEIEMELTAEQSEERYLHDLEDKEDLNMEYWREGDYFTPTPAEEKVFEEMLIELFQKPLEDDD